MSDATLYWDLASDLTCNLPVTFVTPPGAPDLVGNHVYTLVSVENVDGVNEYIVRNPWGQSGDSLENYRGVATLTYAQLIDNFTTMTVRRINPRIVIR